MLKGEMDRLTGEVTDAEAAIRTATKAMTELEQVLDAALLIASNCAREYLATDVKPNIRRRFNQGLFKALYIGPGGEVERFEMTEPFATLLDSNLLADLVEERKTGRQPTTEAPSDVDQPEAEHRSRPATLLESSFTCRTETDKPDGGAVRLGSNKIVLVPAAGFEPAPPPPRWRRGALLPGPSCCGGVRPGFRPGWAQDLAAYLP